ncbi:sugar-binding domain-containing protein [Saccharomonospora sp. NPDC046836]|uniref:sugar-binding transcriptional regulator n=1 Tax=Saccharomonospora sp. NPDC046836 TaxID=3156921 RepID=UPI0033D9538E
MNPERRALVLRAAELYYGEQRTMEAIAQELSCSRATVSRLVSEARTAGLVEITVHREGRAASTLERLIADRFGVEATVVVPPVSATEGERLLHVATQAAAKLRLTLAPDLTIAITWGITIATLARNLTPGVVPGLQVVQMSGSGNTFSSGAEYASGVFDRFGAVLGARVHHFPVPAFFDSPATRTAMWSERSVQRILRMQQRADIALFSVGALNGSIPGHLYRAGYLDREDLRSLTDQSVVGDLGTVFLHARGSSADIAMNQRSSGTPIETLRRIPRRMCVALGAEKAPVLRAALLAGAVTELIVDTKAAERLIG